MFQVVYCINNCGHGGWHLTILLLTEIEGLEVLGKAEAKQANRQTSNTKPKQNTHQNPPKQQQTTQTQPLKLKSQLISWNTGEEFS